MSIHRIRRTLILTPWLNLFWLFPVGQQAAIAQVNSDLPRIPVPTASEAQPATEMVPAQRARLYASPVEIFPGRSSVIDFSHTGEVITYVQLSDLSRIVYDTNAPIGSGVARTIILRSIQPLVIEGTTINSVPNLVVSTLDADGNSHTYVFNLHQQSGNSRPAQHQGNGITIAPASEVRQAQAFTALSAQPNVLQTGQGQATIDDIEHGLERAIALGYTPDDDPVVFAVEQAIALARNGTPLRDAASQLNLDLAILTSLGELGLQSAVLEAVDINGQLEPIDASHTQFEEASDYSILRLEP